MIFEDGTVFFGRFFTKAQHAEGEIVFNTAMTGYQEVLTDPSYSQQCVIMTYPLIGSYGITPDDNESDAIGLQAILCKEYVDHPSNWQSIMSVKTYLDNHDRVGVEWLDTRAMTLHVRQHGAQRVMITSDCDTPVATLLPQVRAIAPMTGQNVARKVTTPTVYTWQEAPSSRRFTVAVLDCGVKFTILRHLQKRGCDCLVLPLDTAQDILRGRAVDGLFISNGPGDPEPVQSAIDLIQSYMGKCPIFGICLGHQLIAQALGARTFKMPFGHHGANHPVKNLSTGKIEITSQNHGFCVDADSLGPDVEITHINLNDGTNEGFRHKKYPLFSVQYHPESAPGPCDSDYLFDDFIHMIETASVHV